MSAVLLTDYAMWKTSLVEMPFSPLFYLSQKLGFPPCKSLKLWTKLPILVVNFARQNTYLNSNIKNLNLIFFFQ